MSFNNVDGGAKHLEDIHGRVYRMVIDASVTDKSERAFFAALADRAAAMAKFRSGLKGGTVERPGKQTLYWIYVYAFDTPEPPTFKVTARRADLDYAYRRRNEMMAGHP